MTPALPSGRFGCIVADPPWYFRPRAPANASHTSRRDVERYYPTMRLDEIKALPVRDIAARDAHLFLWATGPNLRQAFEVIDAWGFVYSGIAFTWVKIKRGLTEPQRRIARLADHNLHVGLGFTTRKNAEFCLLARRGSARRVAKDVREIILSPVREHSRKPEEARERIERYCAGPYVELFARDQRPGWVSWGLETEKFSRGKDDAESTAAAP